MISNGDAIIDLTFVENVVDAVLASLLVTIDWKQPEEGRGPLLN